jgi:hypothetical protein
MCNNSFKGLTRVFNSLNYLTRNSNNSGALVALHHITTYYSCVHNCIFPDVCFFCMFRLMHVHLLICLVLWVSLSFEIAELFLNSKVWQHLTKYILIDNELWDVRYDYLKMWLKSMPGMIETRSKIFGHSEMVDEEDLQNSLVQSYILRNEWDML